MKKVVLEPDACKAIEPSLAMPAWVHRYTSPGDEWTFSIATLGEPGSKKLSLGGFRIAPENRVSIPGYNNDREALQLGIGMEEKVFWSRRIQVGGPLGLQNLNRIVGGKCVLKPTPDARVGSSRDKELLDFAVACFKDFEASTQVFLTTGQDLGHGVLSDGVTPSLKYIHERFKGSILSDTSNPTAEGNYYMLLGALHALGIQPKQATVGLIGCGNIGEHVLMRLREQGIKILALESVATKRERIKNLGIEVFSTEQKAQFLTLPFDALALNANGGSLDPESIKTITQNPRIKFICGCENLVMSDPQGAEQLRAANKIYCPTELCGMMGYLTAVEEYLSYQQNVKFSIEMMLEPARKLEEVGCRAVKKVIERNHALNFEEAVREVYP